MVRHSRACPRLFATYREAAETLRVSESMIKKLVRARKLTAIKIGRCSRILIAELSKFSG